MRIVFCILKNLYTYQRFAILQPVYNLWILTNASFSFLVFVNEFYFNPKVNTGTFVWFHLYRTVNLIVDNLDKGILNGTLHEFGVCSKPL